MADHDDERANPERGQPSARLQLLPEDAFTMPFEPGEIVGGKYRLLGLIGIGGIGFVVAATHIELDEKVAIKFLRPEALANAEAVGRFAREARASAQIKSDHVVRVFDVGNLPGGAPFIVMEYLEGKDLAALVEEQGPLPIKTAVEHVLQACEALASAHACNVVHRDVKPENLFLHHRAEGVDVIKVLDFGISKVALTGSAFESRHPLVRTTMAMGSPTYMSPEQIRASKDIDARTDVWSLGCVLYELIGGSPAFDAVSLTQISAAILEREPRPLRLACPEVPAGLDAVVQRCLAKSPGDRFQNVAQLAAALFPYGPPHARISVERCCSILRLTDISLPSLERRSAPPPPSVGADSRAAVEVAASASWRNSTLGRARSARELWLLGLAAVVGIAYTVVSFRSAGPDSSEATSALAAAPALEMPGDQAAPAAEAPSREAPSPELAATAVPAPAAAGPEEPMPRTAPAHGTTVAAPAPPVRRRASPPPPRPKAPVSPRPSAAIAGEPDVGF